ncbi:MAG: cofactor-independent phosphoglycerate mutase [Syntrophorhabdaceae bacterium]|nr:cofactor-independent phosphoglycerate mutase [Syntrophorhabdaceae bacterium]
MSGKYLILVGDGMADWPIAGISNRTPLDAASKPNMDFMASNGAVGMVQVVPKDMYPGSDTSNLSILGYDPAAVYTGRSPLEAASMGVKLGPDDVAVRCNVLTLKNEGADTEMEDFSGGHITTEEAGKLLDSLQERVEDKGVRFYRGVSYRHLMVWPDGADTVETTPPHDIHGKKTASFLPKGKGSELFREIMEISREIFRDHPVNRKRISEGKLPGNSVWFWGQGKAPRIPTYKEKFGLAGSVVAAVDLIKGIGIYAGLDVVQVPGATGYLDTNYAGKAEYALRALEEKDFVLIHVEAPDEAGHNGDVQEKIKAIERIDKEMLGPILSRVREKGGMRVLLMPDHSTPVVLRTHTQEPVPFVFYPPPPGLSTTQGLRYTEDDARKAGNEIVRGTQLIDYLLA